jgi:hypothetical protein
MFHPVDHPMERGWVGRVDGDRVVQLAAQTLQSFFTGGGSAREHAEYAREEVVFLAPVLHPPSVRIFESQESFAFANPAAIVGPGATVSPRGGPGEPASHELVALPRVTAVIGAEGAVGGFTILAEWRAPGIRPPKDRDFALGLGPVVVTPDATTLEDGFDWAEAVAFAAEGTVLHPGDVLAGPASDPHPAAHGHVAIAVEGIGVLEQRVAV